VQQQDLVGSARLRYLGTSAQKARLVVDLIRGQSVGEALARLRFTKKAVARDVLRLLDSAVANARQKHQETDVDRLYVRTAFVDGGPSLKRIRPAPMGRAFRVLKRMCHVTIGLGERTEAQPTPVQGAAGGAARPAGRKRAAAGAARRAAPKAKTSRRSGAKGSKKKTGSAKRGRG
jgi:large subunit ribosomal protein L22